MIISFAEYPTPSEIPVTDWLKNKKLRKYFTPQTSAMIVCVGQVLADMVYDKSTPFFYSAGKTETDNFSSVFFDILSELPNESKIKEFSSDMKFSTVNDKFSQQLFVEELLTNVSPIDLFKALPNMPVSFISIEFGLRGENAVLYSSASSLLMHSLYTTYNGPVIIGSAKLYADGRVKSGAAMVDKEDIRASEFLDSDVEAVTMFEAWAEKGGAL